MDIGAAVNNVIGWIGDAFTAIYNHGDAAAFVVVAAIAIASAILVVTSKEIMHSAFYLALVFALVFTCVAVTYFFLNAELVGVIQMMVYVGAITILFAFSVMLTRRTIVGDEEDE